MGAQQSSSIALALAGGGPLGGIYELGALLALHDAIPQLKLSQLPLYVGVSAGAVISASLANGFTIEEMAERLLNPDNVAHPIHPAIFFKPAWREYGRRVTSIPGQTLRAVTDYLQAPWEQSFSESLFRLRRALPAGIFDSRPLEKYLRHSFGLPGRTNDFRELSARLFVIASDLDRGESVRFGDEGWQHISISQAVQASMSVPGLYTPVDIEGRHFVDGALYKTVHASAALDHGADLVLCVNPLVPFNNDFCHLDEAEAMQKSKRLLDGGLVDIVSQSLRALIHSRSQTGFRQYATEYPDKDVILFEPDETDAKMFFSSEFSFKNRLELCAHSYESTLADLNRRSAYLESVLAKHGLALNMTAINHPTRSFDYKQYPVGSVSHQLGRLSEALNQLERLVY